MKNIKNMKYQALQSEIDYKEQLVNTIVNKLKSYLWGKSTDELKALATDDVPVPANHNNKAGKRTDTVPLPPKLSFGNGGSDKDDNGVRAIHSNDKNTVPLPPRLQFDNNNEG